MRAMKAYSQFSFEDLRMYANYNIISLRDDLRGSKGKSSREAIMLATTWRLSACKLCLKLKCFKYLHVTDIWKARRREKADRKLKLLDNIKETLAVSISTVILFVFL